MAHSLPRPHHGTQGPNCKQCCCGHQSPTQPPWQPHSAPQNTMATAFYYPQCCGNHFLPPTTPGNHILLTLCRGNHIMWQPHSPAMMPWQPPSTVGSPHPGSLQAKPITQDAPATKLFIAILHNATLPVSRPTPPGPQLHFTTHNCHDNHIILPMIP